MEKKDLSLIINTAIDDDGLNKGIKEMQKSAARLTETFKRTSENMSAAFSRVDTSQANDEVKSLRRQLDNANVSIERHKSKVNSLQERYNAIMTGEIKINSTASLEKQLEEIDKEYAAIKQRIREIESEKAKLIEIDTKKYDAGELKKAEREITLAEIKKLDIEFQQLEKDSETLSIKEEAIIDKKNKLWREGITALSERIAVENAQIDALTNKVEDLSDSFENVGNEASEAFEKASDEVEKTSDAFEKVSDGAKKTAKHTGNAGKGMKQFASRLKSIAAGAFVFNVISAGLTGLRKQMSATLKKNSAITNSLALIKGNLLTAFQPIYEAVLPALQAFMNVLARVSAYLASFTNMLFGKSVSASQTAAKALYEQADATKKAGDAANEALGSYDKLNVISQDIGAADTDTADGSIVPDFSTEEQSSGLLTNIAEAIKGGDPEEIGGAIADLLMSGYNWAANKISSTNWKAVGKNIASFFNGVFRRIDGKDVAAGINAFINAIWDMFSSLMKGLDYGEIIQTFVDVLKNLDWGTIAKLGLAVGTFKLATFFLSKVGSQIKSNFGAAISGASGAVSKAGGSLGNALYSGFTSPLMLIPAAVGGLLIKMISDVDEGASQYTERMAYINKDRVTEATQKLVDEVVTMTEGALADSETRLQQFGSIDTDFAFIDDLADKYFALAQKEGRTAEEEERLKMYHDMLVEDYPELAEILDNTELSYEEQAEAVKKYTASLKQKAYMEAAQEYLKETYKEMIKLQKEQADISDEYNKKQQEYYKTAEELSNYNKLLGEKKRELQDVLQSGNQADYERVNEELIQLQEQQAVAEEAWLTAKDNYFAVKDSYDGLSAAMQQLESDADYYTKSYTEAAQSLADETGAAEEETDKNLTKISEDFERSRADIKNKTDKTRGYIDGIGNSTEEAKKNVSNGTKGMTTDFNNLKTKTSGTMAAIKAVITGSFSRSEFQEQGKNVIEGLDAGLNDTSLSTKLKRSVSDLAGAVSGTFKKILRINSPSKLFRQYGKYTVEGFNCGVEDKKKSSLRTVGAWVSSIGRASGINLGTVNINSFPIPKLATGAVIPPNREFMAVLGDQKHGNNIEAPEALIRKIVKEESGGTQTIELTANLDGEVIYRNTVKYDRKHKKQFGTSQFA